MGTSAHRKTSVGKSNIGFPNLIISEIQKQRFLFDETYIDKIGNILGFSLEERTVPEFDIL